MPNVLIFGGSGFIGQHYRNYLSLDKEFKVYSFDIAPDPGSTTMDIRKTIEIPQKFGAEDIIVNLAAVHRTPGHPDLDYFETNIKGAENVCEFAERAGIKNIIFTSSIAPYGASEDLKKEDTLPTPNTPYGISKLIAEHIHKIWASLDPSRKLLILRPGVVFGKGENGNYTRLARAISKGLFFYPGRKNTVKACIYVKDLVQLSLKVFEAQQGVKLLNFTYEPAPTIQEIAETISEVIGKRKPVLLVNGKLLKSSATVMNQMGFGKLGIHPDRVKKLMTSTNISGEKLKEEVRTYNYTLSEALEDWYKDCNKQGLF